MYLTIFLTYRLVEDHYLALKPLLVADPLLIHVLVYICPRKQLQFLIQKIPAFVSAAWIAHLINIEPHNLNLFVSCYTIALCIWQKRMY